MSPMNNRRMVPTQEPGILDFAPGAAAAYSLRNLSLSYSGPVVSVRRSTDNSEADFTASEVSDGTLAAWCSGGDGFVKQWWSQTGSNHSTQTTAGYQPQIVDSGTLITEGGKAAVQFDGTDDKLVVQSSTASFAFLHKSASATFAVARFGNDSNPSAYLMLFANGGEGSTKSGVFFGFNDLTLNNGLQVSITRRVSGTNTVGSGVADAITPNRQTSLSILLDPSNASASDRLTHYVEGAFLDDANTSTLSVYAGDASENLMIGAYPPGTAGNLAGTISELLIYPSDQTALRTRIEGNLAWTYSL